MVFVCSQTFSLFSAQIGCVYHVPDTRARMKNHIQILFAMNFWAQRRNKITTAMLCKLLFFVLFTFSLHFVRNWITSVFVSSNVYRAHRPYMPSPSFLFYRRAAIKKSLPACSFDVRILASNILCQCLFFSLSLAFWLTSLEWLAMASDQMRRKTIVTFY